MKKSELREIIREEILESAFENRRIKGIAIDKLRELGYDVYASDSGNNIIIVYNGDLNKLLTIFKNVKIYKGQALISLGKTNQEILKKL